jgi:hypothetical protein
VTLSALAATYTGSPVNPAVQTEPDGLIVLLTYSQGDKPVDAPVNAGTYTVTATVDDTQYQGTTTGTLEIRKANASINVFGWSGTYTGSPHGATGSATGVKGENLGSLMSFPDSYTNVPGGTSRWRFAGNTNYNSANGSVGIVISKAKATISVSGWKRAYDGKPHGAVLNYARGVLGESLSSLVKLGSQTYTSPPGGPALWTFAGNLNYLSAAGSVSIAISKANATIDVSGWSGEYDGFAHGADGSARGVLGENLSGLLNLGSSFSSVGTHTAYWSFAGNNNYNSDSGSVPIKITEPPTTTTTPTTEAPPPPGP